MLYLSLGHLPLIVLFIPKPILEVPVGVFCRMSTEITEANAITLASHTGEIH